MVPPRLTSGLFPHFHIFGAYQRIKAAGLLGLHLYPARSVFSGVLLNFPLVKISRWEKEEIALQSLHHQARLDDRGSHPSIEFSCKSYNCGISSYCKGALPDVNNTCLSLLKKQTRNKGICKISGGVLKPWGTREGTLLLYCQLSATSLFVIVVHTMYFNFRSGAIEQYHHGKPSCC